MDALSTDIGSPLRLQPGAWIARNWWLVALGFVLGIAGGFGYLSVAPKSYASTSTLRVEEVLDLAVPGAQLKFEEINMDDEAQILRSEDVAARAAALMSERLEREVSSDGLLAKVALRVPANTEIFRVTFTAGDPETAQAGAQAFADAYIANRTAGAAAELDELVASLEASRSQLVQELAAATAAVDATEPGTQERTLALAEQELLSTQIAQINQQILPFERDPDPGGVVLDAATLPSSPASPQPMLVLGSGAVLGLLLGGAVGLTRQGVQRLVRAPDDVEARLGLRTLGHITQLGGLEKITLERGVGRTEHERLRNVLLSSLRATDSAVLVTSPMVRPVTGAVVANLAAAFGRSGSNVAVLDLTSDGIAEAMLDADNGFGFRDLFHQRLRVEALLSHSRAENVTVVRSGRIDLDPEIAGRLASSTVEELFDALRSRFDFVFVAADGSLGDGSAPQSLALASDAAVVVAEVGKTPFAELQALVRSIEDVGTPVHGTVVTSEARSLLPFNAVRARRLGPDRQLEPPRPPSGPGALKPGQTASDDAGLVRDAPTPPPQPHAIDDDDEPVEAELMDDEPDEDADDGAPTDAQVVPPAPAPAPGPDEAPEARPAAPGPARNGVGDDVLLAPSGRWALTDGGLIRVDGPTDAAGGDD